MHGELKFVAFFSHQPSWFELVALNIRDHCPEEHFDTSSQLEFSWRGLCFKQCFISLKY